MALNQAQINELNKLEGFEEGFSKGQKIAAGAMGDIALVLIPGGGVIKIGRVGSKLASAAYKRLVNAFGSKVKLINKPTAAQVKKAQPPSTVLKADGTPKANVTLKSPQQVATNRLAGQGSKVRQQRRQPRKDTATVEKVPPKPAAPGLASKRMPVAKPKPKPNVKSTKKLAEDVKAAAAKRAAQQRVRQAQKRAATVKKVAKPAAVAAGLGVAAVGVQKATGPKKARATTPNTKKISPRGRPGATTPNTKKMPATGRPRAKTPNTKKMPVTGRPSTQRMDTKGISPRGRPSTQRMDTKGISPRGRPSTQKMDTKGISPTGKPKAKTPNTKKMPPKGRPITAGPNVGFGPKGNIFPKDAADRRRLMAKYGGTGSAAARRAAQGKQGNLKKGSK
jgi:hypothetical protein